ncbi:MAG: DUF1573 domain-containing protein [Candidatus Zixiibacteriota bacterium]|nr:MAG: DUF1573 domain-containing protein [candidate division Zixibacteria bacterium]
MSMIKQTLVTLFIINGLAGSLLADARLKIAGERFEMGSIPPNTTVAHRFWFKSKGTDTVFIDEITTNCGCELAPLKSKWIAPGDSMQVEICWNTDAYIGPTGTYPYIYYNGDRSEPARVFLTGTIVKFVDSLYPARITPYVFDLSEFRDISYDSISFTIENRSKRDLAIRFVSTTVDECELSFPDSIPAGTTETGYIKVKEEYLDKEFKKSFTIEVEGVRTKRVTIPVRRKLY